jgi:sarcosine oxidase subunit gamma
MPDLPVTAPVELPDGPHGQADRPTGVGLRSVTSRALVSVIARRGKMQPLAAAVREAFGVELPAKPQLARGRSVSFLWAGHNQWLAMADRRDDLCSTLKRELGPLASLSDQSDARVILELSGTAARQTLAKLMPIDLHPRAFQPNDTALTLFGHVAGQITQIDDTPVYELMAPRSFAESFAHDLLAATAEFGIGAVS